MSNERLKTIPIGRFAPTPSGFLHLGNIFCSLIAWLYSKSQGGKIILRIEDLDPQRCSMKKAETLARDLEWLGLTWDEGAYHNNDNETYFQSNRTAIYQEYFAKLQEQNLVYPCFCSRSQLHASEAPHLSDGRFIYSGTCRNLTLKQQQKLSQTHKPAYRVKVNDKNIVFNDGHYGTKGYNLCSESGDFIVRRSDGIFAYQFAVTVDDALMGINQVVRGCDLLSSTSMQIHLYQALNLKPPAFFHVPLLTAADGRRLAKRDGDLEINILRQHFKNPEYIIGILAYLAGQISHFEPITPQDLLPLFDPQKVPVHNIVVPYELLNL